MSELPFPGFNDHIRLPLEATDPVSFRRVGRVLLDFPPPHSDPFSFLIKRITGKHIQEYRAREHWQKIIGHKADMELRLQRIVSIQTAAVDYFSIIDDKNNFYARQLNDVPDPAREKNDPDSWLHRIYAPDYHMERLKTELMRSRRYNHALSTVLLDIDGFSGINETCGYRTGDTVLKTIVTIIRTTIRSVDDIARCHGDRFLLILPDTNRREAVELAERLRSKVEERTARIKTATSGVTVTLSAGQCNLENNPAEHMKLLETALERGKKVQKNRVYTLE